MWVDTLIVGGGFGGAMCARHLERLLDGRGERILLVAPENFLLFSPLLPEAASGTLEPRHTVVPLHELLRRTEVLAGEVTALDLDARRATVVDVNGAERNVSYRVVVLAPGSVPATMPIPGLAEHAVGFKTLADAIWLRNHLLRQFDAATAATDLQRRRELLTFTFVGGGYAGVEALAELESFAADALRAYDALSRADLRWVLVEAQDRLLPGLAPALAAATEQHLRRRGVEVRTSTRLESCTDRTVVLSDPAIAPYRSETIVWTAGQAPSPLVATLGVPTDRGRLVVDDHCRVDGRADVLAIGDAAAVPDPAGGISPLTAQHALRQATVAARNAAAVFGVGEPVPFRYRSRGLAVTLGKFRGVAQIRRLSVRGPLAWWLGRSYHLLMVPGLGRKARIVSDWTIAAMFPRDVAQLGQLGRPAPLAPAPPAGGSPAVSPAPAVPPAPVTSPPASVPLPVRAGSTPAR